MGCFDINGSISKLPVTYDDDCFLMIGVINKEVLKNRFDFFGNCFLFTPIALPIYGTYNDYGIIDNIVRDRNVEIIESIIGIDIDKAIQAIDNNMIGRYSKNNEWENICNQILNKLDISSEEYELGISIDHRFIYDSVCNLPFNDIYVDFNHSLAVTKEIPYTLEDCLKNEEFKEHYDVDKTDIIRSFESLFDKVMNEYKLERGLIKDDNDYKYDRIICNLNPNYLCGVYRYSGYSESNVLMSIYKEDNVHFLLNDISQEYIKFLNFFSNMRKLNWNISIHNYSSQNGIGYTVTLKKYFENIVKFIKRKEMKYQ